MTDAKEFAVEWVEGNEDRLADLEQEIWEYAEPAWREYRSAEAYVELLRGEGFEVEEGSGEMPTAFFAEWGEGEPVLASYAEYDAVPENSQKRVPRQEHRDGLHPYAAGHTDPHSVLGVGALGGVLATKAAMEEYDIEGTLQFFGEPAEKVCGSKPVHAAKGYFDEMDAAFSYHPYPTNTTVHETHCGSYWSVIFQFECKHPEEWADPGIIPGESLHAQARCPGALDAVTLMYTNTKYTKEAMFPSTGTWTMNEYIMTGGQKTSDNLAPRFSQIQYCWRSPELAIQERMYEILRENAEQAAAVTECTLTERWVAKTRVGLANNELAELTYENMAEIGEPELSEEAKEFGRDVQRELGVEPMEMPFEEEAVELTPPEEYEAHKRENLPDWQTNFTSDDYVDYTWHAPTVRLYTGRPRLAPPDEHYSYPEWAYNALGGVPEVTHPGMFLASKTIATSMIELLSDREKLAAVQAEFEERTGGGVGGSEWVGPLLEEGFYPPVDLAWPEYVETERGREWSLPTPHPDAEVGLGRGEDAH